ncbi:MAG: type II toxin-antitoxin system RelE/ParE family toxin [Oscillospiraceae bacterium]|nr:type II toxin-antitoxin system RelE/ParE family toxin [Oscillospiraceae bacterium]
MPAYKQELTEILRYIAYELYAPEAARRLNRQIDQKLNQLQRSPALGKIHISASGQTDYRRLLVKNYTIFYKVDEDAHTINLCRVLYARRDFNSLIQ